MWKNFMKLNGRSNQSQRINKREKQFESTKEIETSIRGIGLHGDKNERKKKRVEKSLL